jgi:hypothetical protein
LIQELSGRTLTAKSLLASSIVFAVSQLDAPATIALFEVLPV